MSVPEVECSVAVVGAGVIGLACAAELSSCYDSVVVLESHESFGCESSSRNSEVIHSGIYYPEDSFKTRWCIEGRERLYEYCEKYAIPHAQVGKIVVATDSSEKEYLNGLQTHCRRLEVPCEMWTAERIRDVAPGIVVEEGLWFPRSGIIDSHVYMAHLESRAMANGGMFAYGHRVLEVARTGSHWQLKVKAPEGELVVRADSVVNAGGLLAPQVVPDIFGHRFEHRFCRGRYFTVGGRISDHFRSLVYPVPPKDGLGIHVTLDLEGNVRLGPDVEWVEGNTNPSAYYDCNWEELTESFYEAVSRYFPEIRNFSLTPGQIGIRSKLFVDGLAHKDFWVEQKNNYVHCLGIESPGLTASLSIAKEVAALLK